MDTPELTISVIAIAIVAVIALRLGRDH